MAKRKSAKWARLWQVAVVLLVVGLVVLFDILQGQSVLPTWDELYDGAGLVKHEEALPQDTLLIEMMDVGNADAILLKAGEHSMLIDAGEREDGETVLSRLQENGVKQLNYVIATHADSDHIGGMQTVLEGMAVKHYIMAFMPEGSTPTTKTYLHLLQTIDTLDIPITEAEVGSRFSLGEGTVEILGPVTDFRENNNQSVICRVQFGKRKFLFVGDAEEQAERALLDSGADLAADLLKVGHHGSSGSSSPAFLKAVNPTYALISCGVGNSYGHPHKALLNRLKSQQVITYRTDLNGIVRVVCDGDAIQITSEKGAAT